MFIVLFKTIPKATNEIVFLLGVLGLFVLSLRQKKNVYFYIFLCIMLGMFFWRMGYGIISSRYASCLIYPFSILAAFFLSYLAKIKKKSYLIVIFLIGIGLASSFAYKNYYKSQINFNLEILSQTHEKYNNKYEEATFIANIDEARRIKKMEKTNNKFEVYYGDRTKEDV